MKPILFLFPIIALALICILYARLSKNTADKMAFKRYMLTMLLVSFCMNLIWELAQIPLYKGGKYSMGHIAFCSLGSVADAIMTILLYLILVFVFRDIIWIKNTQWAKGLVIVCMGGFLAGLSEMRHLAIASWVYDAAMPIIPLTKVGLLPVLQFAFLPMLIYRTTFYLLNRKRTNNKLHLSHF